jgi:AcrR family transcriptional regulator
MATNDDSVMGAERPEEAQLQGDAAADMEPKSVTERVLDSAEKVLLHHGYAGFSTRRVAQEANIALGNLTYHFPTKAELVRALIDRLMSKYLEYFEDFLRTPSKGLEALVRWLLEEAPDDESMRLFREIWAMALHDDIVRQSIDDFYDRMIERVTDTLIAAHPAADPRAISDLVHFVAVISEGSSVIYGTRSSRATPHPRMIDLAMRMVSVIAGDLELGGQGTVLAAEPAD